MSIYKKMGEDWETYCLMAGIAIVEEFSKPKRHIQIKNGKKYWCYQAIRLKMKDKQTIDRWIKITRIWERKLNQKFITDYFQEAHKEKDQYLVYFLPNWAYHILKEVKRFPSKHTDYLYRKRIRNWKFGGNYKKKYVLSKEQLNSIESVEKNHYDKLFLNKELAAGAFIISFDLEFRGSYNGRMDLCMSDKYKDFLEFMLSIANKWNWSTKDSLSPVSVEYSRNRGIKASNQFNFRLKIRKLGEIYNLAGPLLDKSKNKAIKHHIQRSSNFVNLGSNFLKRNTKGKILETIKKLYETNTTELQYHINIGTDVILGHLHKLEKEGFINKRREGKRYIWSAENASKSRNTLSKSRRRVLTSKWSGGEVAMSQKDASSLPQA